MTEVQQEFHKSFIGVKACPEQWVSHGVYLPRTFLLVPHLPRQGRDHALYICVMWKDCLDTFLFPSHYLRGTLVIVILLDCMTPALLCLCPCLYTPACHCHNHLIRACLHPVLVDTCLLLHTFFLYWSYLSCAIMSSQKLPLQCHLPPTTSITFPAPSTTTLHGYTASSTTNFVIWGSTVDSTVVGGVLYWEGHSSLYPSMFHIPHSIETLMHADTHTLGLRLLAFYLASKTENQKTPHTCLYQPHRGYCLHCPSSTPHM
jgi:hypothetical protein